MSDYDSWVKDLSVGDEVIIYEQGKGGVYVAILTKVAEVKKTIVRTASGHRFKRNGYEYGYPYRSARHFETHQPTPEWRFRADFHASEAGKKRNALLVQLRTTDWFTYETGVLEEVCTILNQYE